MSVPTVTTQHEYITALTDALLLLAADEQSDLYGVMVTSGPLPIEQAIQDSVAVLGTNGSEEWYGLDNIARNETYTVGMTTLVIRPGADEAAIRAVRARAYAIHNAIATAVRSTPQMGTGARVSEISGLDMGQGPTPTDTSARFCRLEWSIRVGAYLEVI